MRLARAQSAAFSAFKTKPDISDYTAFRSSTPAGEIGHPEKTTAALQASKPLGVTIPTITALHSNAGLAATVRALAACGLVICGSNRLRAASTPSAFCPSLPANPAVWPAGLHHQIAKPAHAGFGGNQPAIIAGSLVS